MQINLDFDSSVSNAPTGYETAIQTAASMLDSIIENPIDVTIDVGYGEFNGETIDANAFGEAAPDGIEVTYNQLVADLRAGATSATDMTFLSGLPATDPDNGGMYFLAAAQEKALGLISATSAEVDGYVGFSTSLPFDFDPGNGVTPGQYDLVGAALHELTHALGRTTPADFVTSMDFLGYGSNGQINTNNGVPRYLSLDGGKTSLVNFDTTLDPGDFAAGSPTDPFDAYFGSGTLYSWTALDNEIMDVLGYNVGASATTSTSSSSLAVFDTSRNQVLTASGAAYSGPVAGMQDQYINITSDNLNITVSTPNWFLHSGSGEDAIQASSGNNVLDGGTGSNFLVGGTGNDVFFVDDRSPVSDIWSSLINFHSGDAATIFGVTRTGYNLAWSDNKGAVGYTGLTLVATASGVPSASLTLVGYTTADLNNGKLSTAFGVEPDGSGPYMYIHAN